MGMSCQILSALELQAHSPQLLHGAATHWCSRRLYAPKEVSVTIWAYKLILNAMLSVLMHLKHAADPHAPLGDADNQTCDRDETSALWGSTCGKTRKHCVVLTDVSVCANTVSPSSAGSPVGSQRLWRQRLNCRLYSHVRQRRSTSGSRNETWSCVTRVEYCLTGESLLDEAFLG